MKDHSIIQGKEVDRYFDVINGLSSFHQQFNYDNNDRAIVVVGVAYIEDLLLYCLENFFPSNSSTVKNMFSHKGFVGTLNAKISLLYTLGFLDRIVKSDLEKMAQIRNEFAHKTTVSFDDEKITKLVNELKWHEKVMMQKAPKNSDPKDIFKVGVNSIVSHLTGIASVCRGNKRKLKES